VSDLFITKIQIKKIRHLVDLEIKLSESEKKHLIITGKNGSGKTSLINDLAAYFCIGDTFVPDAKLIYNDELSPDFTFPFHSLDVHMRDTEKKYLWFSEVFAGNIFWLMRAHRVLNMNTPKKIEPIKPGTLDMSSMGFLDYLNWLKHQEFAAIAEDDSAERTRVRKWFDLFERNLRMIYDSDELNLTYDSKNLSFKVTMPGHEPFGLNELADGYSSLLYIVTQLMMKMENKASMTYDLPGIVFIDEIEAHLHVELQKRVLPFLIGMFPRIQFIVTTHSPFVINSIENAVVYDLEHRTRVEDLSAYSYEGIIKHYFDIDMYSEKAKSRFEAYRSLVDKADRTEEEDELFFDALTYLKRLPPIGAARELVYAFNEMEMRRNGRLLDG